MKLSSFIPALQWSRHYQKAWLRPDLMAGLTVGVMLIPQAMAYALLAGMPPIYGLYASTLPLLIYALLGTSRQLSVGPVAMIALLTAAGIGSLAQSGSTEYISMAILLALMAGILQFGFGLFRLGFVVNFLSRPVISGFTSAAGLIIFFSQLKHLFGLQIPRTGYIHQILIAIFEQADAIHYLSLGVGLLAILIIALLKRFKPAIPGPLVVVILGIVATYLFELDQFGMQVVGAVPEGLPSLASPNVSIEAIKTLFPTALAIAMLSFMQSIAAGKALQLRHRDYDIRPNQELIAIGFANIGSALAQGFPVAGGFARSAVNDQAGAKTGLASFISALIVILSLLFLTPIFFFLPNTILAAIIMYAAIGLVNIQSARKLWNTYRTDFWLLLSTFAATLSLGIEEGIGVG
ncbi:MAG: sulfate permease, partial [Bacteroidota bacterium]